MARIAKTNGLIIWNVATDADFYDCTNQDVIVDGLVADGVWKYAEPPLKINNIVFSDCGSALLGGYSSSGLSAHGLVYIMRKCEQWYKFMMLGFRINVKVLFCITLLCVQLLLVMSIQLIDTLKIPFYD